MPPTIEDAEIAERGRARKLLVCAGKVYYTLLEARRERGIEDIGLMRMEQIYRFPEADFKGIVAA